MLLEHESPSINPLAEIERLPQDDATVLHEHQLIHLKSSERRIAMSIETAITNTIGNGRVIKRDGLFNFVENTLLNTRV